jgi:endonuclease/exonuclease/phosphatase family metal-dependent hydrolase
MRLATFNILHGRTVGDGIVDASRLAEAVTALDPDVLGMQEVDRRQRRSGGVDQTRVAAEAMGAVWARFVPAIEGTPGERWSPAGQPGGGDGPEYGIALLSRYPVVDWRAFQLPALPMRAPVRTGDKRWILARDEPRAAVSATIDTAAGRMTVTTTHLSFVPGWNVVQLRRLLGQLAALPGPHVLTGDLNMPAALPRSLAAWRRLATASTYPAHAPAVQLDHVLMLGNAGTVTAVDTPDLPLSDHRALVVDLAEAQSP